MPFVKRKSGLYTRAGTTLKGTSYGLPGLVGDFVLNEADSRAERARWMLTCSKMTGKRFAENIVPPGHNPEVNYGTGWTPAQRQQTWANNSWRPEGYVYSTSSNTVAIWTPPDLKYRPHVDQINHTRVVAQFNWSGLPSGRNAGFFIRSGKRNPGAASALINLYNTSGDYFRTEWYSNGSLDVGFNIGGVTVLAGDVVDLVSGIDRVNDRVRTSVYVNGSRTDGTGAGLVAPGSMQDGYPRVLNGNATFDGDNLLVFAAMYQGNITSANDFDQYVMDIAGMVKPDTHKVYFDTVVAAGITPQLMYHIRQQRAA